MKKSKGKGTGVFIDAGKVEWREAPKGKVKQVYLTCTITLPVSPYFVISKGEKPGKKARKGRGKA